MGELLMAPAWPLLLLVALIAGSFLSVVTTRFAEPSAIVWTRSRCPQCGNVLGIRDLVPLASWLFLRGRCRHCDAAISPFYLLVELAALVIAAWSIAFTTGWVTWITAGFGWVLLALAIIDWQHFVLPDFLTIPLIPVGLGVTWVLNRSNVVDCVIGAIAGFTFVLLARQIYWLVRRREGIGLGDAKLLAAAGAWVGWQGLPMVVLIAALLGLVTAVIFGKNSSRNARVPFGAFLALSIWVIWLYGIHA